MKQYIKIIMISFLSLSFFSCGEDEKIYRTFERPNWNVDLSGKYPLSMTAIVCLPENLKSYESDNDMLAAFVDDECRGVGSLKILGESRLYFVMIKGMASEQSKVSFRYYCNYTSYLYTTNDPLAFEIDKTYGTADEPMVLNLLHME